jgi:hypothetical protein
MSDDFDLPPEGMQPFTVSFPPAPQWIPNQQLLSLMGEGLLAIAGQSLDYFQRGDEYARRQVVHSEAAPWWIGGGKQLIVAMPTLLPGRAGQQQFQDVSGEFGKVALRVTTFVVDVVHPWPTIRGGETGKYADPDEVIAARHGLWRDHFIVRSALLAYSLGGVTLDPPIQSPGYGRALVGESRSKGPAGGLASIATMVDLGW